ncbi:hypothetical protein C0993_005248 [Termitomyces sp. T159_Od127]|nr:hypothetical protein C0993_005248 [Termitomyces sp. T159_Od127]
MERLSAPFDPAVVVTTDRLDAYVDDDRRPMLNNYTRHAKIGDGHHGEVYLCYQLNARLPQGDAGRRIAVAMKSVKRDNARAKQLRRLRQQRLPTSAHTALVDRLGTTEAKIRKEIAIMKKCRHPHVVRLYEVIDDRSKEKIYMVMEYLAGGEVRWHNDRGQPILSGDQTRRIVRDAVLGLEYLHHQGIIHRDIKPANLLYTQDRCQVKIADFGVSHFSYAQRLAAAGADGDDDTEHVLLDDSDLTKRAGTPSFLAPEIVYEHTNDPARPSSPYDPAAQRPPITKAIDVWALGVTLYCLLFGRTPFTADPAASGTEWSLYNSICNLDWPADDTMCADRIPTGGRRPRDRDDPAPGAPLVRLLDRLLTKDPAARITLDQVKRHPWLLHDIPEPAQWLRLTLPKGKIDVSADETSDAMSAIRFQWNWNSVARRVSSLFRRTREQHANNNAKEASLAEHDDEASISARGAVMSDPHAGLRRHQSAAARFPPGADADDPAPPTRTKGKQREREAKPKRAGAGPGADTPGARPKSTEPWPLAGWARGGAGAGASRSTSAIPFRRRGSASLLCPSATDHGHGQRDALGARVHVQVDTSATAPTSPTTTDSAGTSPTASRGAHAPAPVDTTNKPRARFSHLFSVRHWRPNKFPGSESPAASTASASATTRKTAATPVFSRTNTDGTITATRRSEEVLRRYQRRHGDGDGDGDSASADADADTRQSPSGSGIGKGKGKGKGKAGAITAERRAASWGQGDEPSGAGAGVGAPYGYGHGYGYGYGFLRPGAPGAFAPRTPSRLSMDLSACARVYGEEGEEGGEDRGHGRLEGEGDNETPPSSASPYAFTPSDEVHGGAGRRMSDRFGPAYFDEDSSTIASGVSASEEGRWLGASASASASDEEMGSDKWRDEDRDGDEGEEDEEEADEDDDEDEDAGEDDEDDDDDDSDQEHGVVFSPRKRPPQRAPDDA